MADFDGNTAEGYEQFEATSLYCPHCKEAVPVRKKLLLILPEGDEYEYLCSRCGSSGRVRPYSGSDGAKGRATWDNDNTPLGHARSRGVSSPVP